MEWLRLSALAAVFFSFAAAAQLNPTVVVLRSATAVVPESCTTGIAPQERPRIEVSQIPEPARPVANVAPPSKSLRSLLHDAQSAAVRGDHAAFRAALTQAKEIIATFPAGGERSAATDVTRVFDDLDRVWSWQLDTPAGSFFDASNPPFEVMRGYPGYEKAISDQLFIDSSGRRFYPTSETRDYLTRQAAQRLSKLGVSAPMRAERTPRVLPKSMTRTPTAATSAPAPAKTRPAVGDRRSDRATAEHRSLTPSRTTTRTASTSTPPTRHETSRVAETSRRSSRDEEKKAPHKPVVSGSIALPSGSAHAEPKSTPAAATKAAPPVAIPMTTGETATAAATSGETAAHEAVPAATDTAGSGTATTATVGSATVTETAATTELTPPSTTSNPPASQQPQGKGIILPIILIVVGVGVLIVLFRASS